MATYIKTLKEDNGDITYPQTKAEAVLLNNGSDLETELSQYVTAEDIASTSDVTPAITTAMIADDAVTSAKIADEAVTDEKIDWTTMTVYGRNSSTVALTTSNQTVLTVPLTIFNDTDVLEYTVTVFAHGDNNGNGLVVGVAGAREYIQVGTWGRTCTFVDYETKANLGGSLTVRARKDASYTLNKVLAVAVVRRIG